MSIRGLRDSDSDGRGATSLLWDQHDGSLPKCCFLSRRIEHRYLAIVLARRKISERDGEAQRQGFGFSVRSLCNGNGSGFEGLRLALIEADIGDHGLRTGGAPLISLKKYV